MGIDAKCIKTIIGFTFHLELSRSSWRQSVHNPGLSRLSACNLLWTCSVLDFLESVLSSFWRVASALPWKLGTLVAKLKLMWSWAGHPRKSDWYFESDLVQWPAASYLWNVISQPSPASTQSYLSVSVPGHQFDLEIFEFSHHFSFLTNTEN